MHTLNIQYPITEKGDVVDTYFGTAVADPYRWLEDDVSDKTGEWVKKQNEVTYSYLENISFRDKLATRLSQLINYERVSEPFIEGKYSYFYKNDGLQNQAALYRQKAKGEPELFLNPNAFSKDGTTSLAGTFFSNDGSILTYLISEGGSDWRKAITIDTDTKLELTTTLTDLKFTTISWLGNTGFYYSTYDKPKGSQLSAKTDHHKLYFHTLGTAQNDDKLIFGGVMFEKHRYVSGAVTEDDQYLVVEATDATSGNKLYVKDLSKSGTPFMAVLDNAKSDISLLSNNENIMLFETNLNAPNKRVVAIDANKPALENWQDVIPETEHVLDSVTGDGYIFARYMVNAITNVKQFDMTGKLIRQIELPGIGTATGFYGKKQQQTLYFTFANYKTPSSIYAYNSKTGKSELFRKPDVDFDDNVYESKQVFYTSKDGTQVPMLITFKKGLHQNANNPTILYGYGGFNVSLQPHFSSVTATWLEQGGVYAVANLRGGGEYGKKWHTAGIKQKKQNVFDDFIAAAEYLIAEKYTSSDYLAISGGSNGGLLVAAAMLQRPELFKVALPAVGVLDMLRYHTFTAGAGWAYDYGTAGESKEMFEYLLGYSPVQNVKTGVSYPATLITTGDHDDRVVPAHSFKFAAQLQAKHTGPNPTMIRIETNAGHGAGTPISKTIEQYADIFGFTLYNMGLEAK
ncbi:MAG: prolyl oligopeptidase [Flavobacteriales bacterium]|jgi:prolyl oligopeptidase